MNKEYRMEIEITYKSRYQKSPMAIKQASEIIYAYYVDATNPSILIIRKMDKSNMVVYTSEIKSYSITGATGYCHQNGGIMWRLEKDE